MIWFGFCRQAMLLMWAFTRNPSLGALEATSASRHAALSLCSRKHKVGESRHGTATALFSSVWCLLLCINLTMHSAASLSLSSLRSCCFPHFLFLKMTPLEYSYLYFPQSTRLALEADAMLRRFEFEYEALTRQFASRFASIMCSYQ